MLEGIDNSHILLKYPVVPNFTHWVHILFHSKIKNRTMKKRWKKTERYRYFASIVEACAYFCLIKQNYEEVWKEEEDEEETIFIVTSYPDLVGSRDVVLARWLCYVYRLRKRWRNVDFHAFISLLSSGDAARLLRDSFLSALPEEFDFENGRCRPTRHVTSMRRSVW